MYELKLMAASNLKLCSLTAITQRLYSFSFGASASAISHSLFFGTSPLTASLLHFVGCLGHKVDLRLMGKLKSLD